MTKVTNGVDEIMEVFFSSPTNRLVIAMMAVHDKDITVSEACEYAKTGKFTKGNSG
jgi:hypothetical protein